MSKQSDAQAAQGYVAKPEPSTCNNCRHFKSVRRLAEWMVASNIKRPNTYTLEMHGGEKNLRCGIGGFAVKKTATCNEFKRKGGAA